MVTPYLGTTYGGTSKIVTELVQGLGSLGTSVDLVTTNANGVEKLAVPIKDWMPKKGYRVQYFPCWHRNDFIVSLSLIRWLFNHVGEYDLVHTNTVFAPLILLTHWICKLRRIPYIMTPHGMLEPWALSYKAWKKRLYYTLFEKSALQQASAIQGTATCEAKNINYLGFNQTIFVSNGIHRQEFEKLPDPEIFYQQYPTTINKTLILFLGRIDPKKGLDLLAPAFAKVHQKFPHTHLVVAGPDSVGYLATAQRYFAQAGILESVTFTGMLKGSLKQAALMSASLYVSPSYSEGFSMSVLEGLASGVPCVITTSCNFPEAAAARAAYVVNINADAIADALIQCLSNPEQAQAMGDRARQFIFENYTWEQSAKRLMQAYKAIIDGQSIPKSLISLSASPANR
jgi:glycosyltransferase involved in cell wall biosynthesis